MKRRRGRCGSGVATATACALLAGALAAPALAQSPPPREIRAHKLRGLSTEVAGLVLTAADGGELAIAALATPLPGGSGKARVPLFVEIDGATLLANNQAGTARLDLYAYALGPHPARTAVAAHLAEAFAVNIAELGELIWQSGLKFHGQLELPPGRYDLKVVVRHYQSEAFGLRTLALEVPDFTGAELLLPLFPGPRERDTWLVVRQWGEQAPEPPFTLAGRAFSPATTPLLVAGRTARANLFFERSAGGEPASGAGLTATARLLAPGSDAPVATAPAELTPAERSPTEPDTAALAALVASFVLPEDVPPGEYALRFELGEAAATGRPSTATPVFVLGEQTLERELLWTDLRWLKNAAKAPPPSTRAAPAPATKPADEQAARRGKRVRQLAREYREALAVLATGPRTAARDALLELEAATLGRSTDPERLDYLQAAQVRVARGLASRDAESLVPVLLLHVELHELYSRRRLYSLIFHSRAVIERVTDLYAAAGGQPGVAASLTAGLGGHLQRANLDAGSRRFFEIALRYEPRHRGALLGLATSFEKYAEYAQAIRYLEPLAQAHPSFGEGLLRLAINRTRTGDKKRSRELFESLLAGSPSPWVASLAFEELARADLTTGDLEGAATLLEAARAQLPEAPGIAVLLAHVYDRQGRHRAALELLAGLPPAPAAEGSPRRIYDRWPRAVFRQQRRLLEQGAEQHRATLERALGRAAAEKG